MKIAQSPSSVVYRGLRLKMISIAGTEREVSNVSHVEPIPTHAGRGTAGAVTQGRGPSLTTISKHVTYIHEETLGDRFPLADAT